MKGRRGLVMGVANDHSIAWGIASELRKHGAELAFTYQGEAFGRRAIPLAKSVNSDIIVSCDVGDLASVDATFAEIKKDLSNEHMTDLVLTIAFYCAVVRVLATMKIDNEPYYKEVLQQYPIPGVS